MSTIKTCLIDQPAGIGDILFIQKIVKEYQKKYKVYLPVKESISWLIEYLDTVCLTSDINFNPDIVLKLDGCERSYPKWRILESKYVHARVSMNDFLNYIDIDRNRVKEDKLYYEVTGNKEYRLRCSWYGTPSYKDEGMYRMDIPLSDTLDNVELFVKKGYTLFDWIKVIENATEIYTTDSALMYLVEKYDCLAKRLVAYSRRKDTSEIDYLFNKSWEYICDRNN